MFADGPSRQMVIGEFSLSLLNSSRVESRVASREAKQQSKAPAAGQLNRDGRPAARTACVGFSFGNKKVRWLKVMLCTFISCPSAVSLLYVFTRPTPGVTTS